MEEIKNENKQVKYLEGEDNGLRTLKVNITHHNVWGGDGNVITKKETKKTMEKKTSITKTRNDTPGLSDPQITKKEQEDTEVKEIQTFKIIDGKPVLVNYDKKLFGVLLDIAQAYVMEGNKEIFPKTSAELKFVSHLMNQVKIHPSILLLSDDINWKDNGNYELIGKLQKMKNRFGSEVAIFVGYDCINDITTDITITFPVKYEKQIKMILGRLSHRAGDFNKHATKFTINDIQVVK